MFPCSLRIRIGSVSRPCISGAHVIGAVLLLAGCVAPPPHPYAITSGYEGAADVGRVTLLPLNWAVSLPVQLEKPSRRVFDLIRKHLVDSGKTVETPGLYAVRQLASDHERQSIDDPEIGEGFDSLMQGVVDKLAGRNPLDVVVVPNLVFRTARIYSGTNSAVWDGVKRPLVFSAEYGSSGDIQYGLSASGETKAISLHVLVYDPKGARIFESYGGLDLMEYLEIDHDRKRYQRLVRDPLLVDESAIRTGIELAFEPFLPRTAEVREAP